MDCETVVKLIHLVFQQIWDKRLVPQDTRDAILLSPFMKDPKDLCYNYCMISPSFGFWKVLAEVILKGLLKYIVPEGQWI